METHFYSTAHLPSDEEQSSQWTKLGGSQPPLNHISLGNPQNFSKGSATRPSFRRTRLYPMAKRHHIRHEHIPGTTFSGC